MANSVDPDRSSLFWSMLFASILNSSVMLSNYLQQTTLPDDIFRCFFFWGGGGGTLRVKIMCSGSVGALD